MRGIKLANFPNPAVIFKFVLKIFSSVMRHNSLVSFYLLESNVISTSAAIAPVNTIIRGCRIAIMAAIKNVLSPNSENKIIDNVSTKACKNPTSPSKLLLLLLLLFASTVLIVSILFIEGKCF